ncbi:MAG: hypothetical protein M5U26_02375 [Planctomycetota bacterium]|nr:hypothetical protein [Planctomycetota bacterium]
MDSLDTDPKIDRVQYDLLRKASPGKRLRIAFELSALAWTGARAAFDRLYPHETEDRRDELFLASIYGRDLARKFIAYRQKVRGPRNGTLA